MAVEIALPLAIALSMAVAVALSMAVAVALSMAVEIALSMAVAVAVSMAVAVAVAVAGWQWGRRGSGRVRGPGTIFTMYLLIFTPFLRINHVLGPHFY
jgi:hypothetical protein